MLIYTQLLFGWVLGGSSYDLEVVNNYGLSVVSPQSTISLVVNGLVLSLN